MFLSSVATHVDFEVISAIISSIRVTASVKSVYASVVIF